jgi:peptidoglycan/xylan/chitin deacetylase (PgdA/CDA1 family)
VTIDDLPVAGPLLAADEATKRAVVQKLCALLKQRKVPAVGFVNMAHHQRDSPLLPSWRRCGVELGNHTWSHLRLQKVGLQRFLADLEKGHHALVAFTGKPNGVFFRYPFLFRGFDGRTQRAIVDKLAALGERMAPVTIDTEDWLYSKAYFQAQRRGDPRAAERYHTSWGWNLQEATLDAERLSRALFDREPPQVLLLHANALNADHLDEYFDWLERRGYRFVPLARALADPAYAERDQSWSPTGDSHWLRLRRSRSLKTGAGEWRDL